MEKDVEKAISLLKDKKYKVTPKRKAMLMYLDQQERYLSAKDVLEYLKEEYPSLSYDTIYRNLHDFVTMAILEETEFNGEKRFKFHCRHYGEHHHHFICTNCGKTIDFHLCPMDFFQEQLPGCVIESHRFEIYGLCEACSHEKTKNR